MTPFNYPQVPKPEDRNIKTVIGQQQQENISVSSSKLFSFKEMPFIHLIPNPCFRIGAKDKSDVLYPHAKTKIPSLKEKKWKKKKRTKSYLQQPHWPYSRQMAHAFFCTESLLSFTWAVVLLFASAKEFPATGWVCTSSSLPSAASLINRLISNHVTNVESTIYKQKKVNLLRKWSGRYWNVSALLLTSPYSGLQQGYTTDLYIFKIKNASRSHAALQQ